ncbi:MAG: acylphosphatase [Deltaproteobacteria bacterium]|nr:acylphosphatase [Deltaproteobacteria bacterium]
MEKRLRIVVSGRVQGVWYRASTRAQAQRLGLVGSVWNRSDGRVEIVAEGAEEPLRELLVWCGKGPVGARVDTVESCWSVAAGGIDAFTIIRIN